MHPVGAVVRQAPIQGAANAYRPRAQGQGFQHIAAAPDAGVQINLAMVVHRVHDFRQHFHRAQGRVNLPAAVGGYQDAVDAAFRRDMGILGGADAFNTSGREVSPRSQSSSCQVSGGT